MRLLCRWVGGDIARADHPPAIPAADEHGPVVPRATGPAPARARARRLPQIDVMRLLICFSVVATHAVSNANPIQNVPANAVVNVLHYTRQAFFFISALVLVHAHWQEVTPQGRVSRPGAMRRRISVLGVPYLLWSTGYAVLGLATAYSWWATQRLPWTWFTGLLQGTDGYHMYFLLVSMEFAVVFPWYLRLLYATRRHHGWLLVGSGLLEVAILALFHYVYQPDGWWRALVGESSLTAYQFWVVAGGVAALHFEQFHGWLVRHPALVGFALFGMCVAATGAFFAAVTDGEPAEFAGRSLQPITIPLSITAIGAFYLVSVWLANRRRVAGLIATGTYLSFGIYLSHPAILTGLLYLQRLLPGGMAFHPVAVTVVVVVLDFVLATLVAAGLSRSRWSTALIGRPPRRGAGVPARAGEQRGAADVPPEPVAQRAATS